LWHCECINPREAARGGARPTPLFTTTDDVVLTGRHWVRTDAPRAAVVLVHGFTASANDPAVCDVAEALHADGVDVVCYDARGHGTSEGHSTLGDLERHDVAAAVEAARERNDRVVLVGASMGAIAALRYAAHADGLAGVVSVSCPAQWRLPRNVQGVLAAGLTRTRVGRAVASRWMGVQVAPRWTNPEPPIGLVPRVQAPLAFLHGAADRFVPASDAAELYEVADEPRRLRIVPDMGHAFAPQSVAAIRDAVDWALDPSMRAPGPR
jgi:alpha-beta hydrolase superfamily lysophospholipase